MLDLKGKKGLIIGIANDKSIAWGCAKVMTSFGAQLAITYLNKGKNKEYVEPLAKEVNPKIFCPLDLKDDKELDAVFAEIRKTWGSLDFIIHSVAHAEREDLHGRVIDSSEEGFLEAMNVSCYTFIKLAKYAEELMKNGGSMITMSYYGSQKIIKNYGIMGPAKAALESSVKYMAEEVGKRGIRVNAISPGPVPTRAASGLLHFETLLHHCMEKSLLLDYINIIDIGNFAAFLVSDLSKTITGGLHYIDCGYNAVGYLPEIESTQNIKNTLND